MKSVDRRFSLVRVIMFDGPTREQKKEEEKNRKMAEIDLIFLNADALGMEKERKKKKEKKKEILMYGLVYSLKDNKINMNEKKIREGETTQVITRITASGKRESGKKEIDDKPLLSLLMRRKKMSRFY